jgi:hypothetical protein
MIAVPAEMARNRRRVVSVSLMVSLYSRKVTR